MKNKLAGILNIFSGLISILIYVGFFFTFLMNQMQGNGITDCILYFLLAVICAVPLVFLTLPAFFMFVVGREMITDRGTLKSEKLLIRITMFFKFVLFIVFGFVGYLLFMSANGYYSAYGIALLVGAVLLFLSWIADIWALIRDRKQR